MYCLQIVKYKCNSNDFNYCLFHIYSKNITYTFIKKSYLTFTPNKNIKIIYLLI